MKNALIILSLLLFNSSYIFAQIKNCTMKVSDTKFSKKEAPPLDPEVGSLINLENYHFVAILKYYRKDSIIYEKLIKRNGLIPYQNEPGDLRITFYNDEPRNVFEYSLFSPNNYYQNVRPLVYKNLLKEGISIEVDIPKQCEYHKFTIYDREHPDKIFMFNVQDAYIKEQEKYFISGYQ